MKKRISTIEEYVMESMLSEVKLVNDQELEDAMKAMTSNDKKQLARFVLGKETFVDSEIPDVIKGLKQEHVAKIKKYFPELLENANEASLDIDYKEHAKMFIEDILKLGSKNNLFDIYLKKHHLPANDLSDFVNAVIDELNNEWR